MTQKTYEDGDTVTYQYDNDGALATITDSQTGITTTHYYDFVDRLASYQETGTGFSHQVGYSYDLQNNLTSLKETINGTDYTTAYAYDEDNRITSVTGGNAVKTYTYDTLGRTGEQETKIGETTVKTDEFEFVPNGSKTTMQVAQHTITAPGQTQTYSYTYDDNGNILSVSDGTNTTSYVYDSANQLIRENNQAGGFTHTWTYGSIGNITGRKEYAYTTGELGTPTDTIIYAWSDDGWGDLIPAYDGTPITYDEIGNFLTDGTWTYTWQHGRELSAMTNGTVTWEYLYNQDGLRTQKTNGTKTYRYVYNGSSLSQMTVGEDTLTFFYDAAGQPMSVLYNGTTYFYITNLQGDVIGLLDANGQQVVAYTYDAWGNSLTVTGSMASTLGQINPLRYRGYVYDNETQLYYLQSRYYNPEIGRFINADAYVSTGQGILGNNMYAYCNNNPVMLEDSEGNRPVVGASLRNETKEEKALSFAYMKEISKRNALRKTPRSLEHNGSNTSTYSDQSDASVIARMLYGEDHNSIEAHLWILENRKNAGNYGGKDFRSLILAKNQFSCMTGLRSLDPASQFGKYGEIGAWEKCVDAAYKYIDGGINAIPKPTNDFNYTYTHSYSDTFAKKFPNGVHLGGTWFYNK